jgi:hypothetical protein
MLRLQRQQTTMTKRLVRRMGAIMMTTITNFNIVIDIGNRMFHYQ